MIDVEQQHHLNLEWQDIWYRSRWHDALSRGNGIALLEDLEVRRLSECASIGLRALVPIQPSQPLVQIGIIVSNHPDIALEERVVSCIEANQGGVQANISFRDMLAEQVRLMFWRGKVSFKTVKRGKEWMNVVLVSLLSGGKAGFVCEC